jgi:thioredoxin reductase (NADPH)
MVEAGAVNSAETWMTKMAVLVVVSDDERQREQLRADLERRFGTDYEVRACDSLEARDRLSVETDTAVAAVVAAAHLSSTGRSGIELLRAVRAQHPSARRVLLVDRGEWGDHPVRRAMVLGEVNSYLFVPWEPREQWLYRPMSEYLADWCLTQPPERVAVSIVGVKVHARSHQLRDLFTRAGIPFEFHADSSDAGNALLAETGQDGQRLPVVCIHPGQVFADPTDVEVIEALGFHARPVDGHWDVAIVGAGPSGLSAAVSAASEGLRTVVLEPTLPGGQAGSSSMIRNYLGFPRGINGSELANRAVEQAWLFGAEMLLSRRALTLSSDGDRRVITTDLGDRISARTVVIAVGVSWRRLQVPALESLIGSGVFYGAASSEADAMAGKRLFIVGGGNSAGQAAVHLARVADSVTIVVRRPSLTETMSDYLIREIAATPVITVRTETDVVDGGGAGRLEHLVLRSLRTGVQETAEASALFVLIGAEPHTDWLAGVLDRDEQGYLLTGADLRADSDVAAGRPRFLETSMPGVFAVGDVRHGSTKRVASSAGSGAIAIQLALEYLADSVAGPA